MNTDTEVEVIAKIYGYMDEGGKKAWSMSEAKKVFEDEKRICERFDRTFCLTDAETLYDTIAHMIRQEREGKHHGHEHWLPDR